MPPDTNQACTRDAAGSWILTSYDPEPLMAPRKFLVHHIDLRPDGKVDITRNQSYQGPYLPYTPTKDRWKSYDSKVEFEFNNAYVRYIAPCPQGDTMTGEAINVLGVRWSWSATRRR